MAEPKKIARTDATRTLKLNKPVSEYGIEMFTLPLPEVCENLRYALFLSEGDEGGNVFNIIRVYYDIYEHTPKRDYSFVVYGSGVCIEDDALGDPLGTEDDTWLREHMESLGAKLPPKPPITVCMMGPAA